MEKRWIKLDNVASTNSYVSERLSQYDPVDGLVVVSDYQEFGRGQGIHSWHSNKGENLLMSLLLFPAFLSASSQFQLSMVTSLAICDTLESLNIAPLIKWPNDILTAKGKIAGILIEHGISGRKISHSIIGIGLNLNQVEFPDFPIPATSICMEKGETIPVQTLAENVAEHIMARYENLKKRKDTLLEQEYLERMYLLNQPGTFKSGGEEFQGVIKGVSGMGELQVERDGKLQTFSNIIVLGG